MGPGPGGLGHRFLPDRRDILLDLPPSEIRTEPVQTHYLGAAALDLPSSFQLDSLKAVFYNIDQSDLTATITVSEKPGDGLFLMSKDFSTRGHQLEDVDLSDKLGRPTTVKAYYNDGPRFWDVSNKPSGGPKKTADPIELEIILKIQESWGVLEFVYHRVLDRAEAEQTGGRRRISQTTLAEWAKKISERYQWRGLNEPPMKSGLALKFGQLISQADEPEWEVDFQAVFKSTEPAQGFLFNAPALNVLIEGFHDQPEITTTNNRTVGGHPGSEKREWRAQLRNNFQWLFHLPEMLVLNLSWIDGSGRNPSSREPNWRIKLANISTSRDAQKTACLLRVWETVLNSIRLSSPMPAAGETDGRKAE